MGVLVVMGAILLAMLIVAAVYGIEGFIYWGVGSFICWAFKIPFEFTFVHGIAIAFIIETLKSILRVVIPNRDNDITSLRKLERLLDKYLE